EAARGDPLEGLWLLALSTGLRRGELLALRWTDIDFEREELRVTKALQRIKGKGIATVETKTPRGRRTVVLPSMAVDALERQRVRQDEQQRFTGSSWVSPDLIFTSVKGTPIDGDNVRRSF